MRHRTIKSQKCAVCEKFKAERHLIAELTLDDETFYACDECVSENEGTPGRYAALGENLGTLLVLERLDLDGMADHFLSDDAYGYVAQFERFVFMQDERGFLSFEEFGSTEQATKRMNQMEDDGFGASEDDAFISYGPGGIEAYHGGTYLGRFERVSRAKAAVSLEMRRSGYYPNVFLTGEHGPSIRRIDVW